ncbi:MAG TPA: CoA transferase, partial [Acidimicrobiia bacterium]
SRPAEEVLAAFEAAEAAIAPVYTMADLADDAHVRARHSLIEVDSVCMPAPVARLERTPGHVRHPGRVLGADTDEVLAELDRAAEADGGDSTSRGESE